MIVIVTVVHRKCLFVSLFVSLFVENSFMRKKEIGLGTWVGTMGGGSLESTMAPQTFQKFGLQVLSRRETPYVII